MWKFASMEAIIQSVMLAGIIVMLKWHAIESMEVDIVSQHVTISQLLKLNIGSHHANAIIVGEVHPSFPLPLRSRYLAQDVMCNGTESSISQCSYNPPSPECYVGNHSAAVVCTQGMIVLFLPSSQYTLL